ncbi:hypothetical protein [Leptolyngbya sp. AN02str]|uniref:hypothetical protein n=1 Tax=Leptolyngbya sp. AN02str TaxID=3423363 RepID=UPI003D311AC3
MDLLEKVRFTQAVTLPFFIVSFAEAKSPEPQLTVFNVSYGYAEVPVFEYGLRAQTWAFLGWVRLAIAHQTSSKQTSSKQSPISNLPTGLYSSIGVNLTIAQQPLQFLPASQD